MVANLRILIGFGFLPAGLKKVLGERFIDADNVGPFHDFLHALWATGPLYRFVEIVQLILSVDQTSRIFLATGALGRDPPHHPRRSSASRASAHVEAGHQVGRA